MQRYPNLYGLGDVDCTATPNDPVCQALHPENVARVRFAQIASRVGVLLPIPGETPPTQQQPVSPGTIVTTGPGKLAMFWAGIPTPVKIIGAGLLAFVGYKKFMK